MAFPARNKIYYCAFIFLLVRLFQRKIEAQYYVKVAKIEIKGMFYLSSCKNYALNGKHMECVSPLHIEIEVSVS